MTTYVIQKGWFNSISVSVWVVLLGISAALYVLRVVNLPVALVLVLVSSLIS